MSNPPTKRFKSSLTIFPQKILSCLDCKQTNKNKPSTCEMIHTFVCSCCFTTWKVCAICKEMKFTFKTFHKIDEHFLTKHNIIRHSPEIILDMAKIQKKEQILIILISMSKTTVSVLNRLRIVQYVHYQANCKKNVY